MTHSQLLNARKQKPKLKSQIRTKSCSPRRKHCKNNPSQFPRNHLTNRTNSFTMRIVPSQVCRQTRGPGSRRLVPPCPAPTSISKRAHSPAT